MNLSLQRKIAYGFAGALTVLLVVIIAAWWTIAQFTRTQRWAGHTREVLSLLEQGGTQVLGLQAAARGFLLGGNEETLRPFAPGIEELARISGRIRQLTADNPLQQRRIDRLEPQLRRMIALLEERIAARRAEGSGAVGDPGAWTPAQQAVEAVRAALRELVAHERQLLEDRQRRAETFGQLGLGAMAGVSALAIGAVGFAAVRVHRELSRRQDAEAALQRSHAQIEDLHNHAPCGYHSLDARGTIVAMNDTALGWLGYRREEVVGRLTFDQILAPESAAAFATRFPIFKQTGATTNIEYTWRRKDGSLLPVLLNATAIYDARGDYIASRATVFDITQLRRAEAERDRFFDLSRDLICLANLDGYFTRVNPAWERTLGHPAAVFVSRPFLDFVHPDDRERTAAETEQLARGEETFDFENRFRARDGTYRWLEWNARAVPAEGVIYASARDITERKRAEERIAALNADLRLRAIQLESANRELESFSYSVSHDLRAPLRHIDGFASMLGRRLGATADPEARRYLDTIGRAAKRMGMLIDDLLAFSRIGRTPLRAEPIDHPRLVADIIRDGHYGDLGRNICWEIHPLPPIRADAAMLRQVWANLIENAVKYSGKNPAPRIVLGAAEGGPEEQVFFVRDNGVGFDMAYADKLFGVFQRLHDASEFEGTGIGLANVRRIISRHGGRTWAEGRPGEGAAFYFSLPRNPTSDAAPS